MGYSNGLTSSVQAYMENTLIEKVASVNAALDLCETANEIRNYLCDKSTINTPDFVLRRYIQSHHPELLSEQNEGGVADDKNISWSEQTIKSVAQQLSKISKNKHGLQLSAQTWTRYLTGKGIQKRVTAFKMAFILQMSVENTIELLLAYNMEPYSVRNPVEFVCLFFQKNPYKYTWFDVEEIMQRFEDGCKDVQKEEVPLKEGMTLYMASEIEKLFTSNLPESTVKNMLVQYMLDNANEFKCFHKGGKKIYLPGYSITRMKKYCRLLRYLSILYPTYYKSIEEAEGSKNPKSESQIYDVGECSDGFPRLHDLQMAMFQTQDWNFNNWKISETDYVYNEFYLTCISHGFAIDRLRESGNNVEFFERKDALLLAYFLVYGYTNLTIENKKEAIDCINSMIAKGDKFDETIGDALSILDDMGDNDYKLRYESIWSCINTILNLLGYTTLYVPAPFDRFILLSLMAVAPEELTPLIMCAVNINDEQNEYLREIIRGEYASLDNFNRQWSKEEKKEKIREMLLECGINLELMKANQKMVDVDDLDFICHVAFDKALEL